MYRLGDTGPFLILKTIRAICPKVLLSRKENSLDFQQFMNYYRNSDTQNKPKNTDLARFSETRYAPLLGKSRPARAGLFVFVLGQF